MTPLLIACKNDHDQIAELLINNLDADRLVGNNFPLHLLCKSKIEKYNLVHLTLTKLRAAQTGTLNLLDAALNKLDENKQSVLHLSIENNHLNIVESLLKEFGVSPLLREGKHGNLPIHLVARTGSIEMFDILKKHAAVFNYQNNNLDNPLHLAALYNQSNFISKFLSFENSSSQSATSLPAIQAINKKKLTPLMVTLAYNNRFSLEELAQDENLLIETRGHNGNSVYHLCAEFNNASSFVYLIEKFYAKNPNLLASLNNSQETVLHAACQSGSLDIVKIVYKKLNDSNLLKLLYNKNINGHTCFHVACIRGFIGIVEYFLNDLKQIVFIEQLDNDMNTPLHLAVLNGNADIVSVLLFYNADLEAKNEDNKTALELSCRLGFLVISKILISNYSASNEDEHRSYPLHMACREGAHEVVKLLLDKGFSIERHDDSNQNCLDHAIGRGHEQVIAVLLEHADWKKLIGFHEMENLFNEHQQGKEHLQLISLFEKKMWDTFAIILDKSLNENGHFDFSILDKPVKSINQHPLMLIARSGQENLIKHRATMSLLELKWRLIPRLAFYFNLMFLFIFLILMTTLAIQLANDECVCPTSGDNNCTDIFFNSTNLVNFTNYTVVNYTGHMNYYQSGSVYSDLSQLNSTRFAHAVLSTKCVFLDYNNSLLNINCTIVRLNSTGLNQDCTSLAISNNLNIRFPNSNISFVDFAQIFVNINSTCEESTPDCNSLTSTYSAVFFNSLFNLNSPVGEQTGCVKQVLDYLISEFNYAVGSYINTSSTLIGTKCADIECRCSIRYQNSALFKSILFFVIANLLKLLLEFLFFDKVLFFLSVANLIEIMVNVTALICIMSSDRAVKSGNGTAAVLLTFFLFPLYLQKVKAVGIYVVALLRTISNSIKFSPIFIILLVGFILTFNMRYNFGMVFTERTLNYVSLRILTLVLGDFSTDTMSLDSWINYFIYLLFVCIMSIVMLNLFIGIAVSDINLCLNEVNIFMRP